MALDRVAAAEQPADAPPRQPWTRPATRWRRSDAWFARAAACCRFAGAVLLLAALLMLLARLGLRLDGGLLPGLEIAGAVLGIGGTLLLAGRAATTPIDAD